MRGTENNNLAYIARWEIRRQLNAHKVVLFGSLPIGAKFKLPGGQVSQVKISGCLASSSGYTVRCWGWEEVVPV